MRISAKVQNSRGEHQVSVATNDIVHALKIPPKASGFGSSINGGELLFLALATCFCNDLYREAAKMGVKVEQVEVEVSGDFGAEGDPAQNITYTTRVTAQDTEGRIRDLVDQTDRLAEIHNTLRKGSQVQLAAVDTVSF